ncbi:MAG TPA: hypothetical protein PK402_04480 [Tepidisphaeraceae bacterium]|nr:hypothetical protein [Tepidisphaeraceae bacterium]
MTESNLRELVTQAIDRDWTSFATDHPALAQLLDRQLLIEHASNRLRDDDAFQKAISDGQAISASVEWMIDMARPFVRRVFDQLIG